MLTQQKPTYDTHLLFFKLDCCKDAASISTVCKTKIILSSNETASKLHDCYNHWTTK